MRKQSQKSRQETIQEQMLRGPKSCRDQQVEKKPSLVTFERPTAGRQGWKPHCSGVRIQDAPGLGWGNLGGI